MVEAKKFANELKQLNGALKAAEHVLITSPGVADGDSLGAQLALRKMIRHRFPNCDVHIVNDEKLPQRYRFLPDVEFVESPETFAASRGEVPFDVGLIVDGGIDRAGRVRGYYEKCKVRAFIDHHAVSIDYPYTIRIVEPSASSTTELIYHISQSSFFKTPLDSDICQHIYLGLIFDTGFFRHSNTTPEALELGAKLLRSGFDFTRVGERGMLERTFSSLQLLAYTLSRAQLRNDGKVIWSALARNTLQAFHAADDDREGIIDHLFLTHGIQVAVLFSELPNEKTKVSFRSQGGVDVAEFARSLTEHGGGHQKAAGANLEMPMEKAIENVLDKLDALLTNSAKCVQI
ncbi:MAG: bifunctional oligoribonuclease/PAP phosphatase NrnA [Deltaproteobacteria bacterium]|nr:bifunctional oligoribonuclease/PAP phosphatase NrnA [Deltaproteobacteria bacterium]